MSVGSLESDRGSPAIAAGPPKARWTFGLVPTAIIGASGSALLALASDLPASPYGPRAAHVWPVAASGAAPGWEGPALPAWAGPANGGPGVGSGHLLLLGAVLLGVVLLGLAWISLWRSVRAARTRTGTASGG